MKIDKLYLVMLCLAIISNTATIAQNNTNAKEFLAHLDSSITAKKKEIIGKQLSLYLKDEPLDKFYKRADSLNEIQPTVNISSTLLKELIEKDNGLPYLFLTKANDTYSSNPDKLDEVAIFMFVGLMRYDYYLGVNPSYAPNGEGWVYTNSFKQNEKLRMDLYLQNNIEKYKTILQFAIKYCTENDYIFSKFPKDILMFNKVMKPYKDLLNELENNKTNLAQQWAQIKSKKLSAESLQFEAQAKQKEKQDNKTTFNNIYALIKNASILEEIWKKVETERNKPDSTLLKLYVKNYIETKKKDELIADILFNEKMENEQKKLQHLIAINDTTKIFVRKAIPKTELINNTSKEEIYNYYDAQKGINTWKYRIAKMDSKILEYLKKYSWSEAAKISLFENLKYEENYFKDGHDETKDLYLTQKEKQEIEIRETNWVFNKQKDKIKYKNVLNLIGETNATLIWHDVSLIKNKCLTEPIENLK